MLKQYQDGSTEALGFKSANRIIYCYSSSDYGKGPVKNVAV